MLVFHSSSYQPSSPKPLSHVLLHPITGCPLQWVRVRRQSLNSWKSSMHSWDLVEIKQRKPTKMNPKTRCGSPITMVYIYIWPSVLSPFPPGDGPGRWRIEEKKGRVLQTSYKFRKEASNHDCKVSSWIRLHSLSKR